MKILYIANARIPTEKAHGYQIMKMCESFSKIGFKLELILPTRRNKELSGIILFDYYRVKNIFKITKIFCPDPYFLLKFPKGVFIKFQTLFFGISLFFYLLLKKNKKGYIFYTRDEHLLPILFLFSKKVVWESHNLPSHKLKYSAIWKKCFRIIAITQGLKDDLIKLGIGSKKILVAPDGVDLADFDNLPDNQNELRLELKLPLDKKIILYSGHLYDWKGALIFAESAKFFSENSLAVFLGGTDDDIKSFKTKYGNYGNILILGRVEKSQVAKYLKAADILVLPNSAKLEISARYTSPLKLFEYMASGKPIVSSNLPAIREILSENSALLVEPDSAKDLADGIFKLLSDDIISHHLSKQALLGVQKYSWEKRADNILDFIKDGNLAKNQEKL